MLQYEDIILIFYSDLKIYFGCLYVLYFLLARLFVWVVQWNVSKCQLKKNAQHESCKLSFIWGKMKTAAWETAPQIALRNCSKETGGRSVYMWFWWRGDTCNQAHIFPEGFCWSQGTVITMKNFSAFLDMGRYKNWAHKISSWKYLTAWRPVLPVFPLSTEHLISIVDSFQVYWRLAAAEAHDSILVEVDGKYSWQVPICSSHEYHTISHTKKVTSPQTRSLTAL